MPHQPIVTSPMPGHTNFPYMSEMDKTHTEEIANFIGLPGGTWSCGEYIFQDGAILRVFNPLHYNDSAFYLMAAMKLNVSFGEGAENKRVHVVCTGKEFKSCEMPTTEIIAEMMRSAIFMAALAKVRFSGGKTA